MTRIIEVDTEDFFCGDEGTIGGIARVEILGQHEANGDIGGWDGWHVYATLIDLRIGGLTITADQLAAAFGAASVVKFEERIADEQRADA